RRWIASTRYAWAMASPVASTDSAETAGGAEMASPVPLRAVRCDVAPAAPCAAAEQATVTGRSMARTATRGRKRFMKAPAGRGEEVISARQNVSASGLLRPERREDSRWLQHDPRDQVFPGTLLGRIAPELLLPGIVPHHLPEGEVAGEHDPARRHQALETVGRIA